jgi:hypothetical protein
VHAYVRAYVNLGGGSVHVSSRMHVCVHVFMCSVFVFMCVFGGGGIGWLWVWVGVLSGATVILYYSYHV